MGNWEGLDEETGFDVICCNVLSVSLSFAQSWRETIGIFFSELGHFYSFSKKGRGELPPLLTPPLVAPLLSIHIIDTIPQKNNSITEREMSNKVLKFYCQKFWKANTFLNKYSNNSERWTCEVRMVFHQYWESLVLSFL